MSVSCSSAKCTKDSAVTRVEANVRTFSSMSSQKYLKFDPAGRPSDDLVVYARALEDDRWRRSSSCLAACFFLYTTVRSEEHTSELQSRQYLVCRLLLEKKVA